MSCRRVQKVYATYDGSTWVTQSDERFVYDGWNVLMVLDGTDSNATTMQFTWGLDLSGSLHGAGGVGGLLAGGDVTTGTAWWYHYDGNGNVIDLLRYDNPFTPVIFEVAHYDYDAYGNELAAVDVDSSGTVDDNPFRFSTKWLDDELNAASQTGFIADSGLYYYGHRYYSPRLGRWTSRDPIAEAGGINLHAFVSNQPTNAVDPLGMEMIPPYEPVGPFGDPFFPSEPDQAGGGVKGNPWIKRCKKLFAYQHEQHGCGGLGKGDCREIQRKTFAFLGIVTRRAITSAICYGYIPYYGTPKEKDIYRRHMDQFQADLGAFNNCVQKWKDHCKCKNCPPPGLPIPVPLFRPEWGFEPVPIYEPTIPGPFIVLPPIDLPSNPPHITPGQAAGGLTVAAILWKASQLAKGAGQCASRTVNSAFFMFEDLIPFNMKPINDLSDVTF